MSREFEPYSINANNSLIWRFSQIAKLVISQSLKRNDLN